MPNTDVPKSPTKAPATPRDQARLAELADAMDAADTEQSVQRGLARNVLQLIALPGAIVARIRRWQRPG